MQRVRSGCLLCRRRGGGEVICGLMWYGVVWSVEAVWNVVENGGEEITYGCVVTCADRHGQ